MLKTKRKRAVVLALIAFFCTAATTYVAVDWKRFGGGFLAYFRGKGDPVVASGTTPDRSGDRIAPVDRGDGHGGSLPKLVAANSHHRRAEGSHGAGGGHAGEEDLFKYGDPAAGGIPPGSFIVAQNENTGGGRLGDDTPVVPVTPQVTGPAPAPGGDAASPPAGGPGSSMPGGGDSGLPVKTPAPAPSGGPTPPAPTPPAPNPPAPNPPASTPPAPPPVSPPPPVDSTPPAPPPSTEPPIQSGTSGETPPPPPAGPPPTPPISSPVSSIPEASTGSMMALGALFLAVAAARQRRRS